MSQNMFGRRHIDTAKPLPFQMRYARWIEGEPDGGGGEAPKEEPKDQTFTQADVDRIVKERIKRAEAKYADYDALKAKAGEQSTAEERIAALEKQIAEANTTALRARIANQHGIPTEDVDLFLTGADEETLTAQAKRLAERTADRKKQGNFVPREGNNPRPAEDEMAAFARKLFSPGD